jgi:hypothetical protein
LVWIDLGTVPAKMSGMNTMDVANTIAKQLGGTSRLAAMIGAKDFLGDAKSLQFKFKGKSTNGANCCVVTLDENDTYTVRFAKVGRAPIYEISEKGTTSMVYADVLRSHFERETGFYLSL